MRNKQMQKLLEIYQENGFFVTDPLFSFAERLRLSASLNRLCKRIQIDPTIAADCVFETDNSSDTPFDAKDGSTGRSIFIIGDIPHHCPEVLSFIVNEQVVKLVRDILGTSEIVTHFANLTQKLPKIGRAINWHRDYPNKFISPISPDMVRTMICLDGMSRDMGATHFMKGSHMNPARDITSADGPIVTVTCDPGAVVAIHPQVLHGGKSNRSSKIRRNIVVQWGRADVALATDITESITGKSVEQLKDMAKSLTT
jgi:phytanoyl-CoA dioxygenase PhyH